MAIAHRLLFIYIYKVELVFIYQIIWFTNGMCNTIVWEEGPKRRLWRVVPDVDSVLWYKRFVLFYLGKNPDPICLVLGILQISSESMYGFGGKCCAINWLINDDGDGLVGCAIFKRSHKTVIYLWKHKIVKLISTRKSIEFIFY